ncbi:MAG TPA: alpha/beta hydrolase [Fimbriimonadaceae bacterium]|nr:alpha/beta hydrolase [Fimbriimonadaceae bacterium]
MKRFLVFCACAVLVGCGKGGGKSALGPFDGLELKAADGTTVFARLVKAKGEPKGAVLMFHQAGSNMHEYDPIAERVAGLGWDCLKVDQRSGGDMWDEVNRTAAQFKKNPDYMDAYQDLEAALKWAEDAKYKKIVAWGSSYSASLVLKLAADHKDVGAVLSFSPGEYFGQDSLVAGWNSKVKVPEFLAATPKEFSGAVYDIYDADKDNPDRAACMTFGTADGIHGSSTLRADKAPKAAEAYWSKVEQFLNVYDTGGRDFGG